jgi:hypothetical protein
MPGLLKKKSKENWILAFFFLNFGGVCRSWQNSNMLQKLSWYSSASLHRTPFSFTANDELLLCIFTKAFFHAHVVPSFHS